MNLLKVYVNRAKPAYTEIGFSYIMMGGYTGQ
jgi:hypothetical protein